MGGGAPGAGPWADEAAWELAALNCPSFIHPFQYGLSSCLMSGMVQGPGTQCGEQESPELGLETLTLW